MGSLTLHVFDVQVVNGSAACHLEVINELGRYLPTSGAWFSHTRSNATNDDRSAVLHPIPATDPLTVEFSFDVRCDPQLSGVPKTIHLTGEMSSKLG